MIYSNVVFDRLEEFSQQINIELEVEDNFRERRASKATWTS